MFSRHRDEDLLYFEGRQSGVDGCRVAVDNEVVGDGCDGQGGPRLEDKAIDVVKAHQVEGCSPPMDAVDAGDAIVGAGRAEGSGEIAVNHLAVVNPVDAATRPGFEIVTRDGVGSLDAWAEFAGNFQKGAE